MNLKELAAKKPRFVEGHRACSGCGFPQIIRTILASTDKKVVVSNATGCLEVTSTIYPFSSWDTSYVHTAFENAAAAISGIESAYKVLKKKGKIKEDIKFIAIAGDGGFTDIGLQALSGALERQHDCVYVQYDNNAYENCLSLDTIVFTENGLKRIVDVKKGEKIYAFDQKDYNLVLKKCGGIFDNGKKRIYELSTFHHTIKATANHPFLILKHCGRGRQNKFVWKTLEEIKVGNEIVVLKHIWNGKHYTFKQIKLSKKGDYKVNKIHLVKIPKKSNMDLMKLLGIYVGDGWCRSNKAEVGFSIPKDDKAREILIGLIKKEFQITPTRNEKEVYIPSINIAKFIDSLGFGNGSKNKTIPPWVFTITKEEQEEFIEGLMLSDGTKIRKSWRYASTSIELLRRLRLLLQILGLNYRVGKIHWMKIKKGKWVVYRKLLKDTEYGYICFSKRKKPNFKKYFTQRKYDNFLIDNSYFDVKKVTNIRKLGIEPTIDLRIENEHNFIANGIVVHNTGVQRSGATPFGASTTTTPAGKVHQGKELFRKDIMKIIIAHNIPYVAQASLSHLEDLSEKAKKAFEIKGPAFINVLQPCTLGWKFPPNLSIRIADLAVKTNFWPLYEVEHGNYKLNYKNENRQPIENYLKLQGRFNHLFTEKNKHLIKKIQEKINGEYQILLQLCNEKA